MQHRRRFLHTLLFAVALGVAAATPLLAPSPGVDAAAHQAGAVAAPDPAVAAVVQRGSTVKVHAYWDTNF
jgi:hypothetical protein